MKTVQSIPLLALAVMLAARALAEPGDTATHEVVRRNAMPEVGDEVIVSSATAGQTNPTGNRPTSARILQDGQVEEVDFVGVRSSGTNGQARGGTQFIGETEKNVNNGGASGQRRQPGQSNITHDDQWDNQTIVKPGTPKNGYVPDMDSDQSGMAAVGISQGATVQFNPKELTTDKFESPRDSVPGQFAESGKKAELNARQTVDGITGAQQAQFIGGAEDGLGNKRKKPNNALGEATTNGAAAAQVGTGTAGQTNKVRKIRRNRDGANERRQIKP
ncbi:MAG: hypothetical protein KDE32_09600 [Novosphingobium sp.]|nr:hypothetical protein [Novosphingobium sp.]